MKKSAFFVLCLLTVFGLSYFQEACMRTSQKGNNRFESPVLMKSVDMSVWHWMYDHPKATPEQLRNAVIQISKDVWNRFYAPIFNKKDVVLLGIYSHMIDSFLYLPDYPLGHMIQFQLEEHMKKAGKIGPEFERVARQSRIAPDLWMKGATGLPVAPESLLAAAERALSVVQH
jgi:hypothetical protein